MAEGRLSVTRFAYSGPALSLQRVPRPENRERTCLNWILDVHFHLN